MSAPLVWFVGNRNPSITEQITSGGSPVDLTGATVTFKMRPLNSSTEKVSQPATVVDAAQGQVRYDWADVDVNTAGFFLVWWEVTLAGKTQSMREAVIELRAHAPVSADMTTLDEVKQQLEIRTDERDPVVAMLISAASEAINQRCRRELTPRSTAVARTFAVRSKTLSLRPYDLRSVSALVFDPSGVNVTLTAADYRLGPAGGWSLTGTFTRVQLARSFALHGTALAEFGEADLRVTGDWGAWDTPDVPEAVRRACIVTVGSWIDRAVAEYGDLVEEQPGVTAARARTWAVPSAAYDLLLGAGLVPLSAY